MKVTMFLSVGSNDIFGLMITSAEIMAEMELCGNVTPIFSSVKDKATGTFHTEPGAKIEVLSDVHSIHTHKVTKLWDLVRERLGVHCVWIDIVGDYYIGPDSEHGTDYHGCVCEFPYYVQQCKSQTKEPLKCSEY